MHFHFFRFLSALVLAVITAGVIASAGSSPTIESTPVPTSPKPDFSSMKFLLGSWTCSTKSSRRPAAYKTTSTTSLDETGYWMIAKSVELKTSWSPVNVASTDMTTYDAAAHRWVDVYTDDQGGYDLSTSPGWSGGTIMWTDVLFSPTGNVMSTTPTTVTKVSDTKTTAHGTFKEKSGRVVTVNTVCNKGG